MADPKITNNDEDFNAVYNRLAAQRSAARPNTLAAASPATPAPSAAPPASTLDSLRGMAWDAGDTILNSLTSGLDSMRSAVRSSPTLQKVSNFFGGIGNALSNGMSQAPVVPQAFDQTRQLPDVMRQAQQSASGR